MLTLVEVDVQMAEGRQGKHLDQGRVLIVESLADGGEVVLGELPVLALR
jgi:hypothetical protein